MADVQQKAQGKGRRALTTPRVDLTPMVDLGFLLITFFMYTTSLARPKALELRMPVSPGKETKPLTIPGEATLILMPASGHRVAWYNGLEHPADGLHWCSFKGAGTLRALIAAESARVRSLPNHFSAEAHKLHVLIKPDTSASFDDIVRSLDEMEIGGVPYYSVMPITPEEQRSMQKFRP